MNDKLIESLARQAGYKHPEHVGQCEIYAYFDHKLLVELVLEEAIKACRNEWYELNNLYSSGDLSDPRAIGIHIGQKHGVMKSMFKIKEHFGIKDHGL